MPSYEANVLERFADLCDKQMVARGSRPVFWSVNQQRILSEDDFIQLETLKPALVTALRVTKFGKRLEKIERNYPSVKMLAFTEDAWQICGA